jgi:hypothetical protein
MKITDRITEFLDYIGKGIGSETHTVACQFAAFLDRFESQLEVVPEPTLELTPEPVIEPVVEPVVEPPVENQ